MSESIIGLENAFKPLAVPGAFDGVARTLLHRILCRMKHGSITLVDGLDTERFGEDDSDLSATIAVKSPVFYRSLLTRGAMGGAETYMAGDWTTDDLTSVVRILVRNAPVLESIDGPLSRVFRLPLRAYHALRRNSREGSRRNIAAHYDLGNDFFDLFLDPTLTYSCGVFEDENASMEEASIAKIDRVCRKLELGADDHLLEIGTGWGGLAIRAAQTSGCRVTTTTISREQYDHARMKVEEAGLSDRIEVLLSDYRDLEGSYDKLVSIEMIEAVGHENMDSFIRICGERLRPDGQMLIQAITVPDRDYEDSTRKVDFIKRYIFPGGHLPSLGAIQSSSNRETDLRFTHMEDITLHYAETLEHWRTRMFENLDRIRALGYPETFLRMWEFYLCYCEGGFRERFIGTVQVMFEKPACRRRPVLGQFTS